MSNTVDVSVRAVRNCAFVCAAPLRFVSGVKSGQMQGAVSAGAAIFVLRRRHLVPASFEGVFRSLASGGTNT